MNILYSASSLLFFVVINFVFGDVIIFRNVQTIYDKSPKLLIRGGGFTADEKDINIALGSIGSPLTQGKDFFLSKFEDGGGIILKY